MTIKKVAFILTFFQDKEFTGGGEKEIYNLIKRLCKRGICVDIYCTSTNVTENFGYNKVYFIKDELECGCLNTINDRAREILKSKGYDAIITENLSPPVDVTIIMPHSALYRQKVVRNPIQDFFYNFRKAKREVVRTQLKWAKQGYRKVIVSSNVSKKDYSELVKIDEKTIEVIYPGVEIPEEITSRNNEIFTFGLSAPGFDRKGGFIFLKALHYLKKHNKNFKAKIIYPGFKGNRWVNFLIKAYGLTNHTEFLVKQSDMNAYYRSIDCMVVPSKEDTFGMIATEAMANKRLVIAGTRCGASEVIEDGVNGFVFDFSGNMAKNLSKKMLHILENKDQIDNIIENGHQTAKELSWDNFCNNFIRVLEDREVNND